MSFRDDLDLRFLTRDQRVWRTALHQKHTRSDCSMGSDRRLAAQNGVIRVHRSPILSVWVSFTARFDAALIIFLEASRAQRNPVIKFYVVPNNAGFADDDTGAMIDEKIITDLSAGMNIDSCPTVGPLGHNPREQR